MGKKYDKPAIIDSRTIDPKGDGCQQGGDASAPAPTSTGTRTDRGQLKIVKK